MGWVRSCDDECHRGVLKLMFSGSSDHAAVRAVPRAIAASAQECSGGRRECDRALGTERGEAALFERCAYLLAEVIYIHCTL